MSDVWFHPDFDRASFRGIVARYVKLLIRARWKADAGFLSEAELRRWKLENIGDDKREPWLMVRDAAATLAHLNNQFIPRCATGGTPILDGDSAVDRLIDAVAFLVQPEGGEPGHNQSLLDAAARLQRGGAVDWPTLVDWNCLSAIRDDLDLLPEPGAESSRGKPSGNKPSGSRQFEQMDGLQWEEVTISFVSDDSVRVSARKDHQTFMFSELGFADKRKGDRPDTRWAILKALAQKGGRIDWENGEHRNRLQAAVKDIRRKLKRFMGLDDDPFYPYRKMKAYETRFTIDYEAFGKRQ